jgi:hypothetical protein
MRRPVLCTSKWRMPRVLLIAAHPLIFADADEQVIGKQLLPLQA